MNKTTTAALFLMLSLTAYAQDARVGINTVTPKSTLDVSGKTDTSGNLLTTDMTGLQAPRLTRAELTAKGNALYGTDQKGTLVYITDVSAGDNASQRVNITVSGYYYFDGAVWQAVANGASAAATEPWYNVATNAGATANTQDIYQMGKNVGVGTLTPGFSMTTANPNRRYFSVSGVDGGMIQMQATTPNVSGALGNIEFVNSLGTDRPVIINGGQNNSDPTKGWLNFYTSGVSGRLYISETGNIGIGNTTPSNKLHVTATANPLKLEGLQPGAGTDEVLTTDATGVVRKLTGAALATAVQEPWYNVATNAGATANTQDIYQMGKVGINKVPGTYDQLVVKDGATDKWFNYLNLGDADNRSIAEIYNGNTDGQSVLSIKTNDGASNSSVLGLSLQGFTNWNMVALGSDNTFNIGRSGGFGLETGRFMTIAEQGNVGIGTSAPAAELDIANRVNVISLMNSLNDGHPSSAKISWLNNSIPAGTGTTTAGDLGLFSRKSVTSNIRLYTSDGTNYSEKMIVTNDGNVGIGTTTPSEKLHVKSESTYVKVVAETAASTSAAFVMKSANGTGSHWEIGTGTPAINASNVQDFYLFDLKSLNPRLLVKEITGNVGINHDAPTEKLHVGGNIKATGSFISGTTTYPDYVLENYVDGESNMNPNYTRKTLNEVETFIKENKHLPGVTPAKDLEKTDAGYNFNVTQLSTQTLEKVEELYLHVIEQQKQIDALKAELKELKGK